jgi:hypothetical protein
MLDVTMNWYIIINYWTLLLKNLKKMICRSWKQNCCSKVIDCHSQLFHWLCSDKKICQYLILFINGFIVTMKSFWKKATVCSFYYFRRLLRLAVGSSSFNNGPYSVSLFIDAWNWFDQRYLSQKYKKIPLLGPHDTQYFNHYIAIKRYYGICWTSVIDIHSVNHWNRWLKYQFMGTSYNCHIMCVNVAFDEGLKEEKFYDLGSKYLWSDQFHASINILAF